MKNIYDVFESRKDSCIDILYQNVQESFVEFELLQNTLEKQQVVIEQAIIGVVDDETNETVMEGFIKDKIKQIVQFLKTQWNKLKEWFKAILNKLLNRGNTKEKLEKKLEAAAKGEPIEADFKEVGSEDAPEQKVSNDYNTKKLGSGNQARLNAPSQQKTQQSTVKKQTLSLNAPKQEEKPKQQNQNFRVPTLKEVLMSKAANRFTISGERVADARTIQNNYAQLTGLIMQHAMAVFQGKTNEDIASVIGKKFNIKNGSGTADVEVYLALTGMVRNEKGEYHVKDIANEIMDYLDNKDAIVKSIQAAEQKVGGMFNNMISNLEKLADSEENQAKLAMVQKDIQMHTKLTQTFVTVLNDTYRRVSTIAEKATNEFISYEYKHGGDNK